ncbi:hypothetical protein LTS17_011611 [Exophiala oligosperma]
MTTDSVVNGATKPTSKPHPSPTTFAHAVLRTTMDHYEEMSQCPQHVPKTKGVLNAEVDHLAFTYATLTELAQVYTSLKSKAWEPVWTINHGPTTSIYYRDPDGNKVELQVDNFDTKEGADAFMKGPLFSMNPIGTEIDADVWAAEILAKVRPSGEEGLNDEEVKRIKKRREIGERYSLPDNTV